MSFDIKQAAIEAKQSESAIANLSSKERLRLLQTVADELVKTTESILSANELDLEAARENGLPEPMINRLGLTESSVKEIADAVIEIANQHDVLGSVDNLQTLPSGIQVGRMRIPLGVIAMIYESRPNVTIDAAALCLKAGNAVILRGGKEAQHSNQALAKVLHRALEICELPTSIVTVIPDPDREVMNTMMTLDQCIDLIIPRGGEGLIKHVTQHSRIPVIQHFKGVCHLYIEASADHQKAMDILENGKTQRTGVCNALETLLVDSSISDSILPKVATLLSEKNVRVHACAKSIKYFDQAEPATEQDWHEEYLALEIAVRVVGDFDEAVEHIIEYGSGHTEVIVTEAFKYSQRFIKEVNSSVVMVNASSRFSDGGQLGLGSEIGISTSKLHAYGPMGAESLTTQKFIVLGDGHVRS